MMRIIKVELNDIITSNDRFSLQTECPLPRSCNDWYKLGIKKSCFYPIYPHGNTTKQQMVFIKYSRSSAFSFVIPGLL